MKKFATKAAPLIAWLVASIAIGQSLQNFGGGSGGVPGYPLLAPDGTVGAPSYSWANSPGMGFSKVGTSLVLSLNTFTHVFNFAAAGDFQVVSGGRIGWDSAAYGSGISSIDTYFSKASAHVIILGNNANPPLDYTLKTGDSTASGINGANFVLAPGAGGGGSAISGSIDFSSAWTKNYQGETSLNGNYTNATASFTSTSLSVTVVGAQTYRVQAVIYASDSTAADGAQLDFNGGSATATNFRMHCVLNDTTTTIVNSNQVTALATAFSAGTLTGAAEWTCNGTFVPSINGTFIVRGAQAAHTTGTLTFSRGSWLSVVNSRPL